MTNVNAHVAKIDLSRLLTRRQGEQIVIAKTGQHAAKLVGIAPPVRRRLPGLQAPLPKELREAFGE